MSLENSPGGMTEWIDPVERMEADDWVLIGRESLTTTKFSPEAKFEQVPYQTEKSIKNRNLQRLQQTYPGRKFEVALVLDENIALLANFRRSASPEEYKQILNNLEDKNKHFIVFARELSE